MQLTHEAGGDSRQRKRWVLLCGLAAIVFAAAVFSASIGAVEIGPAEIAAILFEKLRGTANGAPGNAELNPLRAQVLLNIRLPRIVLTALAGAALAVSGAAIQGLFRNPLAEPGLIGVSNGAAFCAALAIHLRELEFLRLGDWSRVALLPLAAFAGSVLMLLGVYRIARSGGRVSVATMLLAGIALAALANAALGLVIFMSSEQQLVEITFWSMGSLGGGNWGMLKIVTPLILLALAVLLSQARPLNLLLLGEAEAGHLGLSLERTKALLIFGVGLAVGVSVAFCGIIVFTGLIVPHIVRLLAGPDHRSVLPGSALLGALLLLVADMIARVIVAPAELPVGVVTALMGAPFFIWLLLRQRSRLTLV